MADVEVAREGVEPRAERRAGLNPSGVLDEPEPGLFKEILRQLPAPEQPDQEAVQPGAVLVVDRVEGRGVAGGHPLE